MLINAIPRGSLAAHIIAADLFVRLDKKNQPSVELREAVTMVGNYILDPKVNLNLEELLKYLSILNGLYD